MEERDEAQGLGTSGQGDGDHGSSEPQGDTPEGTDAPASTGEADETDAEQKAN